MRTTTAWILQREPALVRLAPTIGLLAVIGLALWITQKDIPVYQSIPAEVAAFRSGPEADSVFVRYAAQDAHLVRPGASVVLVASDARSAPLRLAAAVHSVTPATGDAARAGAELVVRDGRAVAHAGPVRLRVTVGTRSLAAELIGTARRGGRAS